MGPGRKSSLRITTPGVITTIAAALLLLGLAIVARDQKPNDTLDTAPAIGTLGWWLEPVERNRFLRPGSNPENLSSVAVGANGRSAWAVGAKGIILYSSDGGRSWLRQTWPAKAGTAAFPGLVPSALANLPEPQRGRPAEQSPRPRSAAKSPGETVQTSVKDAAPQGEAEGSRPLRKPSESDVSSPNTGLALNHVHFLPDGKRGWIVGDAGLLLTTLDGERWFIEPDKSPEPVTSNLLAIAFDAQGERRCIAGIGVLQCRDSAAVNEVQPPSAPTQTFRAVAFASSGPGWAAGDHGVIEWTEGAASGWKQVESGTGSALHAVVATAGPRAWAVGDGGVIVATKDRGRAWVVQQDRAPQTLRGLYFTASGERGWAVGDKGTVLGTVDGGASWQIGASRTTNNLKSLAFANDGLRGIAVGDGYTLLQTRDAGRTWEPAKYRKYPAPWFYAGLVLIAAAVAASFATKRSKKRDGGLESIVDKGESDEPIEHLEDDRLGFAPLVKGLARYLRNLKTVPPLTIAINAPWGGGKSSIMRMLRTEMGSVGVESVWFNAWHHQKEEVMLAALAESIRRQAVPHGFSARGLRFRVRLLWRRMQTHPWLSLIGVCILLLPLLHSCAAVVDWVDRKEAPGWVQHTATEFARFWDTPEPVAAADTDPAPPLLDKLAAGKYSEFAAGVAAGILGKPESFVDALRFALVFGTLFIFASFALRSFPGSPAVLLASVARRLKIADLKAQTCYRQHFKENFGDVCEALWPRTMLIFVDDLDRCEPAKSAEMLEAINYLVNSGRCFVVIGMARDIVESQLMIHFERVADVHEPAPLHAPGQPEPAENVRRRRLAYVRNYLRKLVNLEVHVPKLDSQQTCDLLGADDPENEANEPAPAATAAIPGKTGFSHNLAYWRRLGLTAVLALAAIALAVGSVVEIASGLEAWRKDRLAQLSKDRETAEKQLISIRESERHAAVALDYVRGKEKMSAGDLFHTYGIVVAGLEFRVPSEWPRNPKGDDVDRCKYIEPKLPGANPGTQPQAPKVQKAAAASTAPDLDRSAMLACWRKRADETRAVEEELNAIKAAHAAAVTGKAHDAFKRVARKAAEAAKAAEVAEKVTGVTRIASAATGGAGQTRSPAAAAAAIAGTPGSPAADDSLRDWWPYAAFFGVLLLPLGYTFRRAPYEIRDKPLFQTALGIWSSLLNEQAAFAVPREVKRFQNRARFYAMRLRRQNDPRPMVALLKRLAGAPMEDLHPTIMMAEEIIVGLTAIHQVYPHLLSAASWPQLFTTGTENYDSGDVKAVKRYIAKHNAHAGRERAQGRLFAEFPRAWNDVTPFLAVAEEFTLEPERAPA